MKIKRYGIYWVNLDPVIGAEMSKTRPAVVVSDNQMNKNLLTVVVCPVTSTVHPEWRSRIQIKLKNKQSEIAVDQIRTIAKARLHAKIGDLSNDRARELRILITEMYGETR